MGASKSTANSPSCAENSKPCTKATEADSSTITTTKKEIRSSTEPVQLPTKSWRALLEEPAPMNKDAKPFRPGVMPKPNTAKAPPTKVISAAAEEDDPEWMQYLSSKLPKDATSPSKPAPVGTGNKSVSRPQKGPARYGKADLGVDAAGGRAPHDAPPGLTASSGVVIHTESYLQLLKEGSSGKKSKVQGGNTGAARRKPLANQETPAAAVPLTMSSLASEWSGKKPTVALLGDNRAEKDEEAVERTVQDDSCIEKLVLDQDLSDPAYYSDAEPSAARMNASAHLLGRRPRVSKAQIRSYVMQDLSFLLDQVVGMMLLRLQRFTDQQNSFFPSTADCDRPSSTVASPSSFRRFVIGLKEVMRRTKQGKIRCLIVAPDIEEDGNSGGLDDRMRELLAAAYQNQTPVIFALSRARLGKALGKHLHISVLGILDARGAQSLLDESVQAASHCQQTWLARLGK